jgi:predicted RNA-binding Zn-ribbon protein involved in translation (DUF1610 family)
VQFDEPKSAQGKCPVCGKPVVVRSTRGRTNYCSRVCASQGRFSTRYTGSLAGPMDRPSLKSKTKLP